MSHGIPLSHRTLFDTVGLGFSLYFVSERHFVTFYIISVISLCQSAEKGPNKNLQFFQPSRNSLVISNEDSQVSPPPALEQTPPAVVVFESLIHPHLLQQTLDHLQTLFPCACCHRKLETAVEVVCWNLPKEDLAYSYSPAITESIFLN